MPEPYQPIDCTAYDELESLAVRRLECQIEFLNDSGVTERLTSRIADVYSRNKQEFLATADGTTIRLDRLQRVDGKPISRSCSAD